MGIGMTNPDPMWHPKGLLHFDIGRVAQDDHQEIVPRVAGGMGNLLNACAGSCKQGLCKVSHMLFLTAIHLGFYLLAGLQIARLRGVKVLKRMPAITES